jgi:putative ABC transport system permease protein
VGKGLWRGLNELLHAGRLDREAGDELAQHVEMAVAERVRQGMDEAEARRRARIELGHPEEARERLRDGRPGSLLEATRQDAVYAARMLSKRPGFSALCVLTIALGVGASTALFALVGAVVLKPLPFPSPDALVRIFDTNREAGIERTGATTGNLADWRRRARRFAGIAGYYSMGRTITADGGSEVVLSAQVSEDFFALLGIGAAVGRTFTAEEVTRAQFNSAAAPVGADPVVVIAHGLWQRRFGSDPGIVGRSITIERRAFRVVGVMPSGFAMPEPGVQLWIPWDLSGDQPRDQHYVGALARLAEGATRDQAEADLNAVANAVSAEHPQTNRGWGVRLVPLREEIVGATGRTLFVLLGAVGLLLLVACANVAVLSLARGLERGPEASIRLALGATRGRLVRQFLVESLLLAGLGGALGALGAALAVAGLRRVEADLPRLNEVSLDPLALLFALAVTAACALVAGLPYASRRARGAGGSGLVEGASRATEGPARQRLRDALVVSEVALAVVLLAGAGLLVRSYERLQGLDPGFEPRGVLVAPIFLDMETYGSGEKTRAYYKHLFERLGALPGVVSVGAATALPTSPLGPDFERPIWPEERPDDERARRQAWVRMVTPRYFETLGIGVREGRAFAESDGPNAPRAVILSEGLARRLWPAESAVGRRLVVDYSTAGTYGYDVVGVVNDVHFAGPRSEARQEIYLPHAQRPYLVLNVALKTAGEPRHLVPAVREALHEVDAQKPAHGIHALSDLLGATYARDRQTMLVMAGFAVAALLLAVFGVHGVLLHRVRERTREIGIRMAIGASRGQVVSWVAGHGFRLVLMGLGIGLALSALSARAVSSLLFGIGSADAASLLAVAALPLTALLVSLHPAWRATRIDAAEVLRRG